jgi:hypothetical protein
MFKMVEAVVSDGNVTQHNIKLHPPCQQIISTMMGKPYNSKMVAPSSKVREREAAGSLDLQHLIPLQMFGL